MLAAFTVLAGDIEITRFKCGKCAADSDLHKFADAAAAGNQCADDVIVALGFLIRVLLDCREQFFLLVVC